MRKIGGTSAGSIATTFAPSDDDGGCSNGESASVSAIVAEPVQLRDFLSISRIIEGLVSF